MLLEQLIVSIWVCWFCPFMKKMFCMAFYSEGGYFMMPKQVWGQSDLICTPHGALENLAYPYKSQILKFWNMGVAIHPELYFEILRPMVKKKLKSDLPFLSYGQKTAIFVVMKKAIFGNFFNIVSLIELNPSPQVLEFLYTILEKDLAQLGLLYWRNFQKKPFYRRRKLY